MVGGSLLQDPLEPTLVEWTESWVVIGQELGMCRDVLTFPSG
jgi:hypothetical protein